MVLHLFQSALNALEYVCKDLVSLIQIVHKLGAGNSLRPTLRTTDPRQEGFTHSLHWILLLLAVAFYSTIFLQILKR